MNNEWVLDLKNMKSKTLINLENNYLCIYFESIRELCYFDSNGKNHHRIDGPAITYADGSKKWYYHGKHIECNSQKEFEKILSLKAFW